MIICAISLSYLGVHFAAIFSGGFTKKLYFFKVGISWVHYGPWFASRAGRLVNLF